MGDLQFWVGDIDWRHDWILRGIDLATNLHGKDYFMRQLSLIEVLRAKIGTEQLNQMVNQVCKNDV